MQAVLFFFSLWDLKPAVWWRPFIETEDWISKVLQNLLATEHDTEVLRH